MELLFENWNPDFIVGVISSVVSLVGAGIILAAMVWILGYIINHLIAYMRGGV